MKKKIYASIITIIMFLTITAGTSNAGLIGVYDIRNYGDALANEAQGGLERIARNSLADLTRNINRGIEDAITGKNDESETTTETKTTAENVNKSIRDKEAVQKVDNSITNPDTKNGDSRGSVTKVTRNNFK